MTVNTPIPTRGGFRFALPPSLSSEQVRQGSEKLSAFLQSALGRPVEVSKSASYELMAKELLSGRVDAAWAPPFVCARTEAMGVRVLVRGVRLGMSSYRSALVCRAGVGLSPERLKGVTAAWVDRDSVAGYLLPVAYLKSQGVEPAKAFAAQHFTSSYRGALEEVLSGTADVAGVFCPPASTEFSYAVGVEKVLGPGSGEKFQLIAYTEEAPNDGVPVSMSVPLPMVKTLESTLLGLHATPEGQALLSSMFSADRFEPAPRMGYRALYRVALVSL